MASSTAGLWRRWSCSSVCLCLLLFVGSASALYDDDSNVKMLDTDGFDTLVRAQSHVWLVEFFQDQCEPCMEFSPHYSRLATTLKGIVKVGALNCQQVPAVCVAEQIQRVPAFKVFTWETKRNPYTKKLYKEKSKFFEQGDTGITVKGLSDFATSFLPTKYVHNVSSGETADRFLSNKNKKPKVLLFSNKKTLSPLYKALSLRFRSSLSFAQASSSDAELTAQFDVSTFPAVFVVKDSDSAPIKYDSAISAEPLAEFLSQYGPETPDESPDDDDDDDDDDEEERGKAKKEKSKEKGEKEKDKKAKDKEEGWVQQMDVSKFESAVLKNEELFVVGFVNQAVDDPICVEKVMGWRKAAMDLKGMVIAAEVNVTSDEQADELAKVFTARTISRAECLTILLFPFGDDKDEEGDAQELSSLITGKELLQAVYDHAPTSFVQHVREDTIDPFARSDLTKPKLLLFTTKKDVPGMYRLLSLNFREAALFGLVHESETAVVQRFKVTKFPYVAVMFPKKDPNNEQGVMLTVLDYKGPFKFHALAQFVMQLVTTVRSQFGGLMEIPKVDDDELFASTCVEPKRLCVIGLFKTDVLVDELRRVATKWAEGGQFSFMWVDVSVPRQAGIAAQLDVALSAVPTAVVVSPTKTRAAALPDSFSAQTLDEFLDGLLKGRVRTYGLPALPNFSKAARGESLGAEAAAEDDSSNAGSAANDEPPVEEEFNLDDVMSESVEEESLLISKEKRLQEVDKELEEEQARKAKEEEEAKKAKKPKGKKKKKKSKAAKDEL